MREPVAHCANVILASRISISRAGSIPATIPFHGEAADGPRLRTVSKRQSKPISPMANRKLGSLDSTSDGPLRKGYAAVKRSQEPPSSAASAPPPSGKSLARRAPQFPFATRPPPHIPFSLPSLACSFSLFLHLPRGIILILYAFNRSLSFIVALLQSHLRF